MWARLIAPGAHPRFRIGPCAPSPAPIRLIHTLCCQSGSPERQDAHCAPRCYGDGCDASSAEAGPADGGGVRRLSVGDGVGSGVGEGVGSAVALGDGSSEGEAEGLGSGVGLGLAEGSTETDGSLEAVGAGVITGSGVAESTG